MDPLKKTRQARGLNPLPQMQFRRHTLWLLMCLPLAAMAGGITSHNVDKGKPKKAAKKPSAWPPSPYRIVIDKSDYELRVYDAEGWLSTYPVVFGNRDQSDKVMEGDRRTPDGTFHVVAKKNHKEWGGFMLLDYPNEESIQRFNERKKEGLVPANAKVGGGIGIHGTRSHEEYAVDKYLNWTNGCISLKYSDIFELYQMIPVGTEVVVQQ
jgi:murein L,D-transpeptidase YafK